MQKKIYTVYSYVDMSFQSRFYELRTQDSPHFSTMLYRASDLHRDRFEVTQCQGAEVALCFHKVMHGPCVFTDVDSVH